MLGADGVRLDFIRFAVSIMVYRFALALAPPMAKEPILAPDRERANRVFHWFAGSVGIRPERANVLDQLALAAHADMPKDRFEVVTDCVGADVEGLRDRRDAFAGNEVSQHLSLAIRECHEIGMPDR